MHVRPLLILLILAGLSLPIWAAGIVGTGTPASCTEAAFDSALAGGGSVTFDCGSGATIPFTGTKSITLGTVIDATGQSIGLSGGNSYRLFEVSQNLTLVNLTLAFGHDSLATPGAAAMLVNSGNVIVRRSTIRNHVTQHGGCPAIEVASGSLTLEDSTVSDNENQAAAQGFAVCIGSSAQLTVQNATFSGNLGGAILNAGSNSLLVHATVAGNAATGSGNTGGIVNMGSGSSLTLRNSLVANNTGSGQCAVTGGTIVDGGGNLQFGGTSCGGTIPVTDPMLGALTDNGGPTRTMALGAGSPALDAAVIDNCPPADQRGVARPQGAGCDIGAYERQSVATTAAIPALSGWGLALLAMLIAGIVARLRPE